MSWPIVPLGEVGDWYGGATPSKGNKSFWTDGTIPWLSPKDMGSEVLAGTEDHITSGAVSVSSVKLVPAGSVAVVVRSGIIERKIPVALVPFETTLNQDMKAVATRTDIDPRWIAWGLRAFERELLRDTRKAGTTVASIEWPRFLSFGVPIPPLDEQHRIVELLEDHLSRLDAAERGLRASLRRLDLLRLLAIRELAVGDLVPLKDLARDSGYGTSTKCEVGGQGPAVVRIPNLVNGRIDLTDEKRAVDASVDLSGAMLTPGDILIIRTNGSKDLIGRSGVVQEGIDAAFASYLIRYRVDTDRVRPEWVNTMLGAPALRSEIETLAASSAGQHNLSLGKLDGLLIPTPSLPEQHAGLERLAELDAQAGALRATLDAILRRGDSLRRSLLAAAFSGELSGAVRPAA
ncbi:MAG: restriction endonuclease subunit S [Microlunatus sp.]